MSRELPEGKGKQKCVTCFGTGELVTEAGATDCPDCAGQGVMPTRDVLTELRISELTRKYAKQGSEAADDIRWLTTEVGRARTSLRKIVALAMDGRDDDPVLAQVRGTAYDALGLYDPLVRKE